MFTLDRCSYSEAKQAVSDWHYSRSYPAGVSHRFGVWEDGRFIGCILYGTGANPNIGKPFGLGQLEIRELVRVALDSHSVFVTQLVAQTLEAVKSDGYRLVISYADTNHGHTGRIYQAGNWFYLGQYSARALFVNGQRIHPRMAYDKWGTSSLVWLRNNVDADAGTTCTLPKHKYVFPFDSQMRRRAFKLAKPYPNAVEVSEETRLLA